VRATTHAVLLFLSIGLMFGGAVGQSSASSSCESGNSTEDRQGCLDSDGDGWSDPDEGWNTSNGADAFPFNASEHADLDSDGIGDNSDADRDGDGVNNEADKWPQEPLIWSDQDGDGYADQGQHALSDDCPFTYGKSRVRLMGCSDIDGDFVPDQYDDDADGDGIRNEMERSASSGTVLYDPFNAESTPPDTDADTIPDVLDHDNDNDGWPDDVELDRGSDRYDPDQTPFNMYFGVNTGFFYAGGLGPGSFSTDFHEDEMEFSMSGVSEIVFEELVIPFLLIPVYLGVFFARRQEYKRCLTTIEKAGSLPELHQVEKVVNDLVKARKLRVYHGLVLRNAIEEREGEFGGEGSTLLSDDSIESLPKVDPLQTQGLVPLSTSGPSALESELNSEEE